MKTGRRALVPLLLAIASAGIVPGQEGRAVERAVPGMAKSCWFLVPPRKPPAAGAKLGLCVVLPGGDGSREFLPFVANGLCGQLPADCVGVLVTAVQWQPEQRIVWPTATNKVPGMQWTTEDHVRAIVGEVEREHAIDPARRCVVAWSSSGPAVHQLLAAADGPFARAYIAMSIWPRDLRQLAAVKGRRYVLDQSPDDEVTVFAHARTAYDTLRKAGAIVRLSTYAGGHGWLDEPLPRFRAGMQWLLSDAPAPAPKEPAGRAAKPAGKPVAGKNLLGNGGFEQGRAEWRLVDNSGTATAEPDKKQKSEGKQALRFARPAAGKLDLLTQEVVLPDGATVTFAMRLKSEGVGNAWVKVWLYDAADKAVHEAVDVVHVTKDGDWQLHTKSWPRQGAVKAVVQCVLVSGGTLWIDDAALTVTP